MSDEEDNNMKETKKIWTKWWLLGCISIATVLLLLTFVLINQNRNVNNQHFINSISSSKQNGTIKDTMNWYDSYLLQQEIEKENYEKNIKLYDNPYIVTTEFDGTYKYMITSDNGYGREFNGIGIVVFDNGKCYTYGEEYKETFTEYLTDIEYTGFYGINEEDESALYFSLNKDSSKCLITYKCLRDGNDFNCELKEGYDFAGCTNPSLNLIYIGDVKDIKNSFKEIKEEFKRNQIELFKNSCETLTYEELARNPEKIEGTKVKLTGEVVQTIYGSYSNSYRVNITKWGSYSTYYKDTVYVKYTPEKEEDRILEDDIITIWGIAGGDYSYTSTMGATITLPLINAEYIEIN